MADPTNDDKKTYPSAKGGTDGDVFANATRRTDNAFAGKKDDKSLIGRDIPQAEQDEEADEWGEKS